MTFYFIGGEDIDFTKIGACSVDTATTAARRTGNARCALKVGTSAGTTDGWQAALSAAVSSFWWSGQFYAASGVTTGYESVAFLDGTVRRLVLKTNSALKLELYKRTATPSDTLLATSSVTITGNVLTKLDVHVVYGTSGSVDVYSGGTLILSYSGDVTTNSATTLTGFVVGAMGSSGLSALWSEIMCASVDTRGFSLVTMAPAANGNTFAWTNSYANIDETTLDDTDLCTSSTVGDLAQTTITALSGISSGNPAIRAVGVTARAQKGGTGPQNAYLNVRTGGNDYLSSVQALPAAFGRVAAVFESNPATSGAWAYTDLTAAGFNIGVKSET